MTDNFLPAIEIPRTTARRRPALVVQSASFGAFEPDLNFSAPSAISEAELVTALRLQKCRSLVRDVNAAFYEDFGAGMNSQSVKGFLKLVKHFEPRGSQTLGADSTGRLVATWRSGEDALTLEFVTAFRFKYAITATKDGEVIRRWGTNYLPTFLAAEPLAARFLKAC